MAAFVDFEYQDGTSDTAGIASISAGSNADRVGVVAAMLASSVSVSSLAWNGSSILPALASGAGPGGAWNVYGYGTTGLASGSSAITLSMPPAGAAHCILAATFDGISSIVSTALVSSGGTPSQPSATVTTVAGDIVVLLGNDLGVYDPTITGTTTGGVTTSVMSGSGFFIGLYCVATGTSTTVGGTFSGSAKNWQGMVFVLRPTAGGTSATASGSTVSATSSLVAGSASASSSATATGATLAAAASLVYPGGTLVFQAAGMEFGARTGLSISTFALEAGVSYRYTVHADGLTLGAALYTSAAITLDGAGKLPNLAALSWITPGTLYRVHAIRQSDGEAATYRMRALA